LTAAALTASGIADAVWDEAISGHAGAGSTGEALSAAGAAGNPWITTLPGTYTAGQAGYIIGTNLNATVSSRATQTSVDTIDTEVGVIDGIVDSIVADTENIQSRIPAALGPNGFIQADVRDYGGVDGAFTSGYPICVIKDNYSLGEEWADGGRLDLILDARASQSSVDTIDGNVDLILADTGTDGVVLSAATCNKIADHARRRTQANVEASSDGDTLSIGSEYGLIQQAQNSDTTTNPGKLTSFKTNGDELGQKTLTTDGTAEPITGIE
jgi:hypothetical protein